MVRNIFRLALLATAILVSLSYFGGKQMYISEPLQEQYTRFQVLMLENNIDVDYSKVSQLNAIPLGNGLLGLYQPETKSVFISSTLSLPFAEYLMTPKEKIKQLEEDYLLVIIAHEVMHSQGVLHVDDSTSIMVTDDTYVFENIKKIGAEQYILNTYMKMDSLKITHPIP